MSRITRSPLRPLGAVALVAIVLACAPRAGTRTPAPAPRVGESRAGLHYEVAGRGDPVVLIHGFHTDHREWDEVAAILAASRRVIRYDLRGHGRSAAVSAPFSAHEDLAQLLDELEVGRADLVGLSAGSTVATELALERPHLVRRLVMVSPGLPGIAVDAPRDWMRPIADAVRAGHPDRAAELWWESPIMEGTRARGAAGERYRQVVVQNARVWSQNPRAQRPLAPAAATRLAELCAPLLVVTGAADRTGSQQQADSIARRFPAAERAVVRGAGHMISIERPGELAAIVSAFLDSARAPRAGCDARPSGVSRP